MNPYLKHLKKALADAERLKALERTELVDSPPEVAFDRLTTLATRLTNAPVSLVSLVTNERQFFKSTAGLPDELSAIRTTPLSHSFCQHAVATKQPLIVEDTRTHDLVNQVQSIEDFGVLSYLGIPLQTPANQTLGTLCLLGFEPQTWTSQTIETVQDLASIAMTEVALRLELRTQHELQTVLRESEARYRSVVDGIHDVVFKLNRQGQITFVNPAWSYVLDADPAVTIGRPISDFLPRDTIYGAPMSALRAHADSQATYSTHFLAKDGTMRWLEVRVRHQLDGREGLAGVITDVTDSYRVDAEREAREQAERHLRLKDALLSNMSHEIRTPISAIMSCTEILQDELDEEQLDYINMIRAGGERLLSTLDKVLLYAQVQSKNFELHYGSFDLTKLGANLLRTFDVPQLTCTLEAPAFLPVQTDKSFLATILRCLLENAVKFTQEGEITVKVATLPGAIHLEVSDTGIGIDPAYLPHLYTPFEQESSGYARSYEGSGLGLALTKELVEALGGTIEVESELGTGSTFIIFLPNGTPAT
ncbi:MAG: ATP-binding protein [Bacteroidota bacterium]